MGKPKSEPPKGPKIKVVDRRKFSAEGEPLESTAPAATAPESAASPEARPTEEKARNEVPTPTTASVQGGSGSSQFLELVTMLAGQAELLLLGTDEIPAQPAEAQRVIDYLGVLEKKTTGNLTADEAKVLSTVLFQLRTFFLQRK